MDLQILDPIDHPDWDSLLTDNKNCSFFHTSAWAKILKKSYGFTPIYFVKFDNDRLVFLMPFMEIRSPIIGKRGVSLPFTDKCVLFAPNRESLEEGVRFAIGYGEKSGWKSIEWRDGSNFPEDVPPLEIFYTHDIDLNRTESEIFKSFDDSNRRNIRKAVREGVTIRIEQSLNSLKGFCQLNCLTRKRHGLPPQPFAFFDNVYEHILSQRRGIVVSAFYSGKVIAASVFFHFGKNALFKYGASNMEFQNLRPNNLLMWETLKWYRQQGFDTLNLGRTETGNPGLLRFKRAWGAKESFVKYYKYDIRKKIFLEKRPGFENFPTKLFTHTPVCILRLIGRLFYKHAG
jgi:hypothetical protein